MITLKTLPQATDQEVFDQVKTHLLSQNVKSISMKLDRDDVVSCMYRTKDGLKCAAGCLIGDDEYDPAFEGLGWSYLVRHDSVPHEHYNLINDLQALHDCKEPKDWESELKAVANRYGLDFDHA